MTSKAGTVEEYLAELPEDRRDEISKVREVILRNLPKGYVEIMQYGMIGYSVPHSIFPAGYHCDPKQPLGYAGLGNQKNYISLYLGCVYMDPESSSWFQKAWAESGKKLDMGKSCVRFKKADDLALEVVGRVIARTPVKEYVRRYEESLKTAGRK